jgi:thioredoxin 1
MALVNVTADNFKEETATGFVLVDFYADWCGPCKMLTPVLEELAAEVADVKIVKVNVDDARELAKEHGVSSIPHLTLLKDGVEVAQDLGFKPKEVLLEWINNHK